MDADKERRWRFRAALARASMTAKEWCERRDLSETQLYRALKDPTAGAPTIKAVDEFIAQWLPPVL